jgi:hypothetical protein
LLLPAAIAHFWVFLGRDDPRVPAGIGVAFTFATIGLLYGALSALAGRRKAMLGAIALVSTPFFIAQGAVQYADIPLSFFFLASVVLLCLFDGNRSLPAADHWGWLVLAGLAAGFAAWTKNEGLLFLGSVGLSRLVQMKSAEGRSSRFRSSTLPLLVALIPGFVLVVCYKHSIGVPGDLFSGPATAFPKLLEPGRYWAILAGFAKGFFRFGHWLWIPGSVVVAGVSIAWGWDRAVTAKPGVCTSAMALAFTVVGYAAVFLITPYDIHWHLRFSLVRLLLQLWPSVLFLLFLSLRRAQTVSMHGI